jgi:hypothetical protein
MVKLVSQFIASFEESESYPSTKSIAERKDELDIMLRRLEKVLARLS